MFPELQELVARIVEEVYTEYLHHQNMEQWRIDRFLNMLQKRLYDETNVEVLMETIKQAWNVSEISHSSSFNLTPIISEILLVRQTQILDPLHRIVPARSVRQLMEFEQGDKRHVAETHIQDGSEQVRVSTVFLRMMSMPPDMAGAVFSGGMFETMVFGGAMDEVQVRYFTWEEAEKGHKKMVEEVETLIRLSRELVCSTLKGRLNILTALAYDRDELLDGLFELD